VEIVGEHVSFAAASHTEATLPADCWRWNFSLVTLRMLNDGCSGYKTGLGPSSTVIRKIRIIMFGHSPIGERWGGVHNEISVPCESGVAISC
jgi:hypothetical protein